MRIEIPEKQSASGVKYTPERMDFIHLQQNKFLRRWKMKHIVNFSGGKDSTAMQIRMIEEGMPIDDIVLSKLWQQRQSVQITR